MLVFLSHSGADTTDAELLRDRLMASLERPEGFRVWLDKADLKPGPVHWQKQIEEAIERADAFIVLIGSRGVVNWVEVEVRQGLSRATNSKIPFVPILSSATGGSSPLPPFALHYQAVRDPLNDPEQFDLLVEALTGNAASQPPVIDEPFVGLRSMSEDDAHLFFGRDKELTELIELMWRERLVAIVSDSGAGKSSLARAALAPAFRGGKLAPDSSAAPHSRARHVLTMRPGADPMRGLRDAVNAAAISFGINGEVRAGLRRRVQTDDVEELVHALNCDLPFAEIDTLLIVDQAEEFVTQCSAEYRHAFLDLILRLADPAIGGVRILLTVRADYFNLFSTHEAFFERLARNSARTQLPLPRLSDEAIRDVVKCPLRLAGFEDDTDSDALVEAIKRETFGRPGDTALIQFALWSAWRNRTTQQSLTQAYSTSGGVYGVLGQEAERVRHGLSWERQAALLPLLVRLVQPSGTGGATARLADLEEFDEPRRQLATHLAGEDGARLLQISDSQVQISHEALIRQWPWLQAALEANADGIRVLRQTTEAALAWEQDGRTWARLPMAATLAEYDAFARAHWNWLSPSEAEFIRAAVKRREHQEWLESRREKRAKVLMSAIRITILLLAGATMYFTNAFLTERFTETTRNGAEVRQAFYSGNLISELQRNSVVPLFLSRDPSLINALTFDDYSQSSQRLISYLKEIGSAGLMLLDDTGRVVGATDRSRIGANLRPESFFIDAQRAPDTVFSIFQAESGAYNFYYSRKIEADGDPIGVIVVEVDLRKFEQSWDGISDAVYVTDSEGLFILSTEPGWRGQTEETALSVQSVPSAIERAIRVTADSTAFPPDGYLQGKAVMTTESRIPFRGWRIVSFTPYASVRERVNGVLALEMIGFALLLVGTFYFRHRQKKAA